MRRLNLGCCDRPLPGYVNVDRYQYPGVNIIVDLEYDWPWEDNSCSEIVAHDVVEHLRDITHTMNEAWRVLEHKGRFHIIVPTTDGRGAFQDPTHKTFWNANTFLYFTDGVPERERFCKHNGVKAAFRVVFSKEEMLPGHVSKLTIVLEAVKERA